MARNNKIEVNNVGIDRMENFLQNYYKQVIVFIGIVILLAVGSYAGFSIYKSKQNDKIAIAVELQSLARDAQTLTSFQNYSESAPFLKNYIMLSSAISWVFFNDNNTAMKDAITVSGSYKEMAEGLAFDLGSTTNPKLFTDNGMMKPLWYYRLVLTSKPEERAANLELFKSKYPNSSLLQMLENWSM